MLVSLAVFFTAALSSVAAAKVGTQIELPQNGLAADSALGMKVLSQARRLENNGEEAEVDMTWVSGYSLKFQGCHHLQQVSWCDLTSLFSSIL